MIPAILCILYLLGCGMSYNVQEGTRFEVDDDEVLPVLILLFWPISGCIWLGWLLSEKIKDFRLNL